MKLKHTSGQLVDAVE